MTPRNPEESLDETVPDKALRAIHEACNDESSAQGEPVRQDAPALAVRQEETRDTAIEPDRVELYLKGPTVFSA